MHLELDALQLPSTIPYFIFALCFVREVPWDPGGCTGAGGLAPTWSHLQPFLYHPEKGSWPPGDRCHQQKLEVRGIGVRCTLPMCKIVGCSPRRGSALSLQSPLCPRDLDIKWPGKATWQVEPKPSEGRKSFLLLFKQGVLHFHSARGPGNQLPALPHCRISLHFLTSLRLHFSIHMMCVLRLS